MEMLKKLPEGFLKKTRNKVTPKKNIDDDIIPIKWSKDVCDGNKKAIVKLVEQTKNK